MKPESVTLRVNWLRQRQKGSDVLNIDNLHELINRYEENLDRLYRTESYELFKWEAMKTWQDEWFKPEGSFSNFVDRYSAATKGFSVFIDNSTMHPSAGVLKLWKEEPETVESLFCDVLLRDPNGSVEAVQDNMDAFLFGFEELRQRHFPKQWYYKQERHSASVYLAVNDPAFNYAFKSSEAHMMAKYIGFGYKIGAGETFSLENYYRLCEEVVSALKEHERLLERHFDSLNERCYEDRSLHMLAFDVIYCSRAYNFYKGLEAPERPNKIKKKARITEISAEELARREAERQEKIKAIESEIEELESISDDCEDISLIGVQVTSEKDGTGTVIAQNINLITVRFDGGDKKFKLDKKYSNRPRFEEDDEIVEAFTEYAARQEKLKKLRDDLAALQK